MERPCQPTIATDSVRPVGAEDIQRGLCRSTVEKVAMDTPGDGLHLVV
ncbi:hypothetical protein JKG47_01670 [Acidithiobacillus sp. MC6.1]|nr:hypothetical protein [Acidithiobacillus sp. MC6.1]